MHQSVRPLEELIANLRPEHRARVREYVEHLLASPAHAVEAVDADGPGPDAAVSLREITAETVRVVCRLSETLTPPKKFMVAPNAISIAQAYFERKAWFRAIYADDVPVGFIMLYDSAEEQEYFLWRLMIAQPHHGKGFGRRAIESLLEYVGTRPGATELKTSCGQGPGSPEGFYRSLGFVRTGEMFGKEVGLSLKI